MKLKVTKWDVFFQILFSLIVIGLFPAITIIIDYSQYSLPIALILACWLFIMSLLVHHIQLKEQQKKSRFTYSDDERFIHVEGKGIYKLQDEKVGNEDV